MTILQLTDSLQIGGAERVLIDLATGLRSYNIHTIVGSIDNGPLVSELRRKGIKVIILNKRSSRDFRFLWELCKVIRDNRVNLIHSHFSISHIYGWLASKIFHVPQIATIHGFISNSETRVFPFILKHTNQTITVADDLKKKLSASFSIGNIRTIYNGVETKEDQLIDRQQAKNRLGLRSKDLVVGSVGTLRKVKAYEFLIEAIAKVKRMFPQVKLLLVGDGPQRPLLQKKAQELQLENTVIFLGYRKDIPQILSSLDVYVCSSLREGTSIAILEAMAASKPVVATNVGGNPEVVENGKTGLLVPPRNPQKIAEAIVSLLNDEDRRIRMGEAGLRRVKERFSISKMLREYEEVYHEVLHRR
ncbi:MAG: hypothetical protein DRG83_06440 [Deltaproteobacteria bacterium]|nr:MAG: hypothetical protein DRG83_06440 [Deltaproteobacteria bacterium]